MCGERVRKCVASLGAAAAARPLRADGKTHRGPARVSVCTCVWPYLLRAGGWFVVRAHWLGALSVSQSCLRGFIYEKHAQLVVSGLALCEWGFN